MPLVRLRTSTFNNVIITITNEVGDVISWSSAGKMGFRGSKNTPYTTGPLRPTARRSLTRHGPAQGESVCQGTGCRS
ncbi:MAG: 30S ribosomal protein S11 [Alistipes finegoldii]